MTEISVASFFGPSLSDPTHIPALIAAVRHEADSLTDNKYVIVSFTGVEHISAATASEMLSELHTLSREKQFKYNFTGVKHAHLRVLTGLSSDVLLEKALGSSTELFMLALAATIALAALVFVIMLPLDYVRAFVTFKLYGWFVVEQFPQAPHLTLWQTWGLLILLNVVRGVSSRDSASDDDKKKKLTLVLKRLMDQVIFWLVSLLVGAVVHAVMMP